MNVRRIISLTLVFSFCFLLLTGIILYIVPPGRVAYWADWRLFGLTKTQWGNIHITTGFLGLVAGALHIYYNWMPIMTYLKNKKKEVKVFTLNFNVALLIALLFSIGTYFEVPPFSWILGFSELIKDTGIEKYGEPPYGHAELSTLKEFAEKVDIDLDEVVNQLRKKGIIIDDVNRTLLDIAEESRTSPQEIYLSMKSQYDDKKLVLPKLPPSGISSKKISDICEVYALDLPSTLKYLADKGLEVSSDMSLKEIAEENNVSPTNVYEMVRESSLDIE